VGVFRVQFSGEAQRGCGRLELGRREVARDCVTAKKDIHAMRPVFSSIRSMRGSEEAAVARTED